MERPETESPTKSEDQVSDRYVKLPDDWLVRAMKRAERTHIGSLNLDDLWNELLKDRNLKEAEELSINKNDLLKVFKRRNERVLRNYVMPRKIK